MKRRYHSNELDRRVNFIASLLSFPAHNSLFAAVCKCLQEKGLPTTPEEQQQKTQERLSRIQEYKQRLKKVDGIAEFENEPAFKRRNIDLDESVPSKENDTSKFSIENDGENSSLNGNNSFLHDNVD